MERASGYYWVQFNDVNRNQQWVPAFYYGTEKRWQIPGNDLHFTDRDFLKIGDLIVYEEKTNAGIECYYVHYHGNDGYAYIRPATGGEFLCWQIEYAIDACHDLKERQAQKITIRDLPAAIATDFDFARGADRIREIYKLH